MKLRQIANHKQIYLLLFGALPFMYLGEDKVLIEQMIGFVEAMPVEWQHQWTLLQKESNALPSSVEVETPASHYGSKLEKKFYESVKDEELMILLSIMKGLMRFLPSARLSANEALRLLLTNSDANAKHDTNVS